MVTHDTSVECPHCGETFDFEDVQVWHVCLTCGRIWDPGEQWRSCNWNDDVPCDGCHAIRRYSDDHAQETREMVLDDADPDIAWEE